MGFLIRSGDGRISICTPSAEVAAGHVERFARLGVGVEVKVMNEQVDDIPKFHERAVASALAHSFLSVAA